MKKYLPRRRHEFDRNGIITSFDYILEEDIQTLYNSNWIQEWDQLKHKISPIEVKGKKAYFYYDYKNLAIGINYYY